MLCHSYPQRHDILYLEPFRLIRTCSTATTPLSRCRHLPALPFSHSRHTRRHPQHRLSCTQAQDLAGTSMVCCSMTTVSERDGMLSRFVVRPWMKRGVRILLILLILLVLISMAGVTFVEIRRHQSLILPAPTGPYAVGRREYDWTDQSRDDPLAPHSGLKRELVVWAWYPALREPGAEIASYLPSKWAQLSDEQHGFIGQQLLQSNDSIQTHSLDRAPLSSAAARYPVLIFEPGLGTIPTQYTTLLEDLASHGYIVFAITPTYSSDVVVFPDGRVVEATPAGKLDTGVNPQVAANQLVTVWAKDVIFVMNQLDRLNTAPGNMFSGRLDLARLGIFGHSFGGATAAQVCHMDARCKAGINLDADLAGDVV